jgi:C1A family cysteine protease
MRNYAGLGWVPEPPEIGDYGPGSDPVAAILKDCPKLQQPGASLPGEVDLRAYCSPVEHQGGLQACTVHAAIGLLEYLQRRAFGYHFDLSRRFLYKVARDMLAWEGDRGAYLRTAMAAMLTTGVPPEADWKYDEQKFDEKPGQAVYDLAEKFRTHLQYRLDTGGAGPKEVLEQVRRHLYAEIPVALGFTVYESMPGIGEMNGDIPFPAAGETAMPGHAVLAVGYRDDKGIRDAAGNETKGALRIRNSWGRDWGEDGYGWLPYRYVEGGLCADFWTLTNADFKNTSLFVTA